MQLIAYTGEDDWVENTVIAAHKVLVDNQAPAAGENCEYCGYRQVGNEAEDNL